jgi:ribonuclease Z
MPKLIILGSSNAIPSESHENTHMALVGSKHVLLIDCASNPIVRLERAGLNLLTLSDIVLTHFHPDHVSGVPLLLMDMWLMGRKLPLNIYALDYTVDRMQNLMEAYSWSSWPDLYPVVFHRIPEQEKAPVLEHDEWRVFSSPVCHLIPAIGLRIEFPQTNKVLAYSCDTEPCPQVVRLAQGADVLIHESTGNATGHTSPSQAGEIASQARAKSLYLIHYPNRGIDPGSFVIEAKKTFAGEVELAKDFMNLDF